MSDRMSVAIIIILVALWALLLCMLSLFARARKYDSIRKTLLSRNNLPHVEIYQHICRQMQQCTLRRPTARDIEAAYEAWCFIADEIDVPPGRLRVCDRLDAIVVSAVPWLVNTHLEAINTYLWRLVRNRGVALCSHPDTFSLGSMPTLGNYITVCALLTTCTWQLDRGTPS